MPLSPSQKDHPLFPSQKVFEGLPATAGYPENLHRGHVGPNQKQAYLFGDEDLQPGVSFLGDTVCHFYGQQLHGVWYLER